MNGLTGLKWVAASCLLFACGGGTRPEDMSATDHDKEARKNKDIALLHRGWVGVDPIGKPGASHYALANSFQHHADDHAAAADALRADQVSACAGIPAPVAGTCPLMTYLVTQVEATAEGVRVTYAGAEAEALLHHARCHVAQGAVVGREGMESCPLYEKALRVTTEAAPGGAVLILSSEDSAVRTTLQGIYVTGR